MKLSDSIKNRMKLFPQPKYISQFEAIMTNMANSIQLTAKKQKKKVLFNYQTKRNKSYWNEIIKAMLDQEKNNLCHLALSYMKLKAKFTLTKLALIASMFDIEVIQVVTNYFALCYSEIEANALLKMDIESNNKELENVSKNTQTLMKQQKINNRWPMKSKKPNCLTTWNKQGKGQEEELKAIQISDIVLEPQRKVRNIFVGVAADFKKLINNKQKIVMLKGQYCHTFIIEDINNGNNSNKNSKSHKKQSYSQSKMNLSKSTKNNNGNNFSCSSPITCNNLTSKNKPIWFNQDLALGLKNSISRKINRHIKICNINIQDVYEKENCKLDYTSIAPTPQYKTKLWRFYPRINPNSFSICSRSNSSRCLFTSNASNKNKARNNSNLINYMNKQDLYY